MNTILKLIVYAYHHRHIYYVVKETTQSQSVKNKQVNKRENNVLFTATSKETQKCKIIMLLITT